MEIRKQEYESPFGTMLLVEADGKLVMSDWKNTNNKHLYNLDRLEEVTLPALARKRKEEIKILDNASSEVLDQTRQQLDEYFRGERKEFTIPLLTADTAFRTGVWEAIRAIPYGARSNYRDVTYSLGRRHGMRSVGTAVGLNPLSVIIPCHRIIHADGTLSGYAGGPQIKEALLKLEDPSFVAIPSKPRPPRNSPSGYYW